MARSMQEALAEFHVDDDVLSDDERDALDRDGFVVMRDMLTPGQVQAMGRRVDELVALEGQDAGKEVHQEAGTDRLADLVNKHPMFEACFTNPRLLAAVAHVLRADFKLFSLNYRAALPGEGRQALHVDWYGRVDPGDFYVVNSGWLLDDFTERNGPTRLVPGSHVWGTVPEAVMDDPNAPHPDEVRALAPAGSVVVFNSHTWHGGTRNDSDERRRVIHCAWVRRDQAQQSNQQALLRGETYARLTPASRYLLDVVEP